MKTLILSGTLIAMLFPLLAQASCESVKADITQKIVANGLPESGFHLQVVPDEDAANTEGQVVGHCENASQKILYLRTGGPVDHAPSP